MKKLLVLSLFSLMFASCNKEHQSPDANAPAPPPPTAIYHSVSGGTPTMTSSTTAAKIIVDSPWEAGAITYQNTSGACTGVRLEARAFGSPYVLKLTTGSQKCTYSDNRPTEVLVTSSNWTVYEFADAKAQGSILTVNAAANGSGSYGGIEVRNIVWK